MRRSYEEILVTDALEPVASTHQDQDPLQSTWVSRGFAKIPITQLHNITKNKLYKPFSIVFFTLRAVYIPHRTGQQVRHCRKFFFVISMTYTKGPCHQDMEKQNQTSPRQKKLHKEMLLHFPSIFCRLVKINTKKAQVDLSTYLYCQAGTKCLQSFRMEHSRCRASSS